MDRLEYNELAQKVEKKLQAEIPLVDWEVERIKAGVYNAREVNALSRMLMIGCRLTVNGKELAFKFPLSLELARIDPDLIRFRDLYTRHFATAILEWRPKQ